MTFQTKIAAEAPTGPLHGLVVLLAGAANGTGAAIARRLGGLGAAVTVGDVLEREGRATADALCEVGIDAQYVHLDVTDALSWEAAIFDTLAGCGGFDILVNLAAAGTAAAQAPTGRAPSRDLPAGEVAAVLLGTTCALDAMRPDGSAGNGGLVVNVLAPGTPAALAAGNLFGAGTACDGHRAGRDGTAAGRTDRAVRVACICPGHGTTVLNAATLRQAVEQCPAVAAEALADGLRQQTPPPCLGTGDDLPDTIALLCTDTGPRAVEPWTTAQAGRC